MRPLYSWRLGGKIWRIQDIAWAAMLFRLCIPRHVLQLPRMKAIFQVPKPLIGMVHIHALPGTPGDAGDWEATLATAVEETRQLTAAGVDGLILENMHDIPYLKENVGPEVTACMAVAAREMRRVTSLPIGVQVLAGANESALAVALAAGIDFIRAEGFVFGHVGDEGWMDANAGRLLRYRKMIGAAGIAVWTDIKKKHSAHAVTGDVGLVETGKAAAFFKSDGLILTGSSTGVAADLAELKALKAGVDLPVVIGSGVTAENVEAYFELADGFIVGSSLKEGGRWDAPIDVKRVEALVGVLRRLREGK